MDEYVRCRCCDSGFPTNCVIKEHRFFKNTPNVKFESLTFQCPACGHNGESYIFPNDQEDKII